MLFWLPAGGKRGERIVTAGLIVLAVLAYLGRSLVMLTSVGGIAVAVWLLRRRTAAAQIVGASIGAVIAAVLAETVHVVYHATQPEVVDHGGFWTSAVLVGLINAAAMLPFIWLDDLRRRRRKASHRRA